MGKGRTVKNIDSLIAESLENIREDRAMASTLLIDLMEHIKKDKNQHQYTGQVAAKYLETLQRSNEQMVKISSLVHKKNSVPSGLSDLDKDELYDLIGKEQDGW